MIILRRSSVNRAPGEHLLGLVELVELTFGFLEFLSEVGALGLRTAFGAVELLSLTH